MRILVTGSEGFVGSNLLPLLEEKGHSFYTWDLKDKKDIFDRKIEAVVSWSDVVIHLAALTNVNHSFEDPEEVFRVNVLGTARMVELCKRFGIKLIYPSSAAVYHPELSPYAESKYLAEQIVRKFDIATVLRFFNIYGPGMNKDSGSLMYEFVQGLYTGELVVFGDGEQTRDFISIQDICQIILKAIDQEWDGKVIDCGTGQAYSINYIAGLFKHYGDLKIKYVKPRREIKWSTADTQMLKTLYKKKLKTNLETDIKGLVDYYATR